VLDVVAAYWRRRAERGYAVPLTCGRLTEATGAEPLAISAAIKRLVGLGLIAVKSGSGPGPM
jgi:hypothetical protein